MSLCLLVGPSSGTPEVKKKFNNSSPPLQLSIEIHPSLLACSLLQLDGEVEQMGLQFPADGSRRLVCTALNRDGRVW